MLTLTYEGRPCNGNSCHGEPGSTVDGDPKGSHAACLADFDTNNPTRTWFASAVTFKSGVDVQSAYLTIDATTGGQLTLGAQVTVIIYDKRGGKPLSTVTFTVSSETPLVQGDYFGSLRLGDFSR